MMSNIKYINVIFLLLLLYWLLNVNYFSCSIKIIWVGWETIITTILKVIFVHRKMKNVPYVRESMMKKKKQVRLLHVKISALQVSTFNGHCLTFLRTIRAFTFISQFCPILYYTRNNFWTSYDASNTLFLFFSLFITFLTMFFPFFMCLDV